MCYLLIFTSFDRICKNQFARGHHIKYNFNIFPVSDIFKLQVEDQPNLDTSKGRRLGEPEPKPMTDASGGCCG